MMMEEMKHTRFQSKIMDSILTDGFPRDSSTFRGLVRSQPIALHESRTCIIVTNCPSSYIQAGSYGPIFESSFIAAIAKVRSDRWILI